MEREQEATQYVNAISFNTGLLVGLYPEIDVPIKDALDVFLSTIESALHERGQITASD